MKYAVCCHINQSGPTAKKLMIDFTTPLGLSLLTPLNNFVTHPADVIGVTGGLQRLVPVGSNAQALKLARVRLFNLLALPLPLEKKSLAVPAVAIIRIQQDLIRDRPRLYRPEPV